MEEKKYYIYALEDLTDFSQTVYVGYTIDLKKRLSRHLTEAASKNPETRNRYRNCWIRSLLTRGIIPNMILLEEVVDENWEEAETFYISYFKSIGMKLCNSTNGGDGASGFKHTEKTIQKMSAAKIGKKQTEENIEARTNQIVLTNAENIVLMYHQKYSLIDIAKKYNVSREAIKYRLLKCGIELRGQHEITDMVKEKLRKVNLDKTYSAETNAKKGSVGMTHYAETRKKISAAHIGKVLSAEHKAKLSAAKMSNKSPKFKHHIKTDEIIELYKAGMSFRVIGRIVGLEHHAVKNRLISAGVI